MRRILFIVIFFIFIPRLYGEIVYLNDGQVLKGAIIKENKKLIILKTKYQKRKIKRNNIKRILFGEREMELVYILLKEGNQIKGFLVDQDTQKVIIRDKKESPDEKTILKSEIKQMSNEEIRLLKPDAMIRLGIIAPIDSGGSELGVAPIVLAGVSLNIPFVTGLSVLFEAGYVKCEGGNNKDLFFQFIPITLNATYNVYSFTITNFQINVVPRLGFGLAIVDFNNGEGEKFSGYDFIAIAGVGGVYEILKRTLFVSLWMDYSLLIESSSTMSNMIFSVGLSYRF